MISRTVHEGKKPFNCDICNANFGTIWKNILQQSMNENVNANFGQEGNLNKHVATVHEGKETI